MLVGAAPTVAEGLGDVGAAEVAAGVLGGAASGSSDPPQPTRARTSSKTRTRRVLTSAP